MNAPTLWTLSGLLVVTLGAACRLSAAYDQEQRRREPSESCCPVCEVGGTGACGGAR